MAYQAGRSKKTIETLELVNEDGSVAEIIEVRLDADGMAEKVSEQYIELIKIQKKYAGVTPQAATPEVLKELGEAVISLYNAVFGEADTCRILDFYEDRTIEMCKEINPFIIDVVLPAVRAIGQQNRKNALKVYNRKQRRKAVKR